MLFCYLYYGNKLANAQLGAPAILALVDKYRTNGWIDEQMTVSQPDKILADLGVSESAPVSAAGPDYQCSAGEYEICFWAYTDATGKYWEHAIAGDGHGNQAFDPLGRSHCGRLGKIVTKRILHVTV